MEVIPSCKTKDINELLMSKLYRPYEDATDLKTINRTRRQQGMDEIKQGYKECLKCDKLFKSKDTKRNRICNYCKGLFEFAAHTEVLN